MITGADDAVKDPVFEVFTRLPLIGLHFHTFQSVEVTLKENGNPSEVFDKTSVLPSLLSFTYPYTVPSSS